MGQTYGEIDKPAGRVNKFLPDDIPKLRVSLLRRYNYFLNLLMRYVFSLLGWLLTASVAFATHLIGGYIQATPVAGWALTYQVTVTLYFSPTNGVVEQTSDISLCFGDNSPTQRLSRLLPITQSADKSAIIGRYRSIHTYGAPGVYTLSVSESNRTLTRNVPADQPMALRTTVQVSTRFNETPTLALPAAGLTVGARQPVTISLAGVDPDGDSLSYALATPLTGFATGADVCPQIAPVSTHQYPNDLLRVGTYRLDPRTGQLSWNLPTETGLYTVSAMVSEWRAGVLLSQTQHELILTVADRSSTPATPPPYEPAQTNVLTALPDEQTGRGGLHLTVSPNPVVDLVRVRLTNDQRQPARLLLLDSQGRTRQTLEVASAPEPQHYQFDVSQYPAGTYLIRAEGNGQQVVGKVVKP